jgi:hypothetical protein
LGMVCNEEHKAHGNLSENFVLSMHIDASVVRTNQDSIQAVILRLQYSNNVSCICSIQGMCCRMMICPPLCEIWVWFVMRNIKHMGISLKISC